MIQARLRKSFAARPGSAAFSLEVEFEARPGITVLFGPSGSGKTLTLDLLAGFEQPDSGRILLDNEILYDGNTGVHVPPQRRECGYVFQNYALFPHMTLRQNLAFAAQRLHRLERHRKVSEMLERFHLEDAGARRPHEVSGGQKQRCSIARALIRAPRLLLLDEPARGLDAVLRGELYDILRQVREDFRIPILLVTHDLEEGFELGTEMLILHQGKLVQAGPPQGIAEKPASVEVARLLGLFNLLPVEISSLDPQRKSSRLRLWEYELAGPYFPGHFKGDRVWLCVRTEHLTVAGRGPIAGANEIPAKLERFVELPHGIRAEFAGGFSALLPRAEFDKQKDNREWAVGFPQTALRVL